MTEPPPFFPDRAGQLLRVVTPICAYVNVTGHSGVDIELILLRAGEHVLVIGPASLFNQDPAAYYIVQSCRSDRYVMVSRADIETSAVMA